MNQTFSIKEAIKKGWEIFKERSWFLIGAGLIALVVAGVMSSVVEQFNGIAYFSASIIDFALEMFVGMGLTYIFLSVYDKRVVSYKEWFTPANLFYKYIATTILTMFAIIGGAILLIVPGIIAMVGLMFAPYLVIDKGMGPIEAIKKSWSMSKGHKWQLFLFMLVLMILNILGVIALVVGLLVTIPVSAMAVIHVYRTLLKATPKIASNE